MANSKCVTFYVKFYEIFLVCAWLYIYLDGISPTIYCLASVSFKIFHDVLSVSVLTTLENLTISNLPQLTYLTSIFLARFSEKPFYKYFN